MPPFLTMPLFLQKALQKAFVFMLIVISSIGAKAQCGPVATVNLVYVSGSGASCVWNYTYSISYSGTSFQSYQLSLSCGGGVATPITSCLSLTNPGITTGTTNNFTCPCTSGTSFALSARYTTTAGDCNGGFFTICNEPVSTIVLPVKISFFQVKIINNTPCLIWKTETEDNIDHYEVEYSSNGVDYAYVGKANPVNNSFGAEYTVCDVQNRTSGFYRIKIKELDGKIKYSEVIKFVSKVAQADIYPNPVTEKLFLVVPSSGIFINANYTVYSATGTAVLRGKILQNYISVNTLAAGVYYFELKNEDNILLKKMFIKQ